MTSAYRQLERRFARSAAVDDALGILQWDMQTMLPRGAIAGRSDQLATLETISHEIVAAPEIGDLLASASEETLTDWQAANLREMKRDHLRATAIPADLLEAESRAVSACHHAWEEARPNNDYAAVKPLLAEVLRLQREKAAVLGAALGLAPYDALLDSFDVGARAATIDPVFASLRASLPELIGAATEAAKSRPATLPMEGPFPRDIQERVGRTLLDAVGFDFALGRLDVSAHPFTGGAFGDVRITTRYDEADFMPALFAVIHEAGHGLYEQGRPQEWRGQPVGEARGMSVHESQALGFEMQASRSPEFFAYLAPLVRDAFGGKGAAWEPDNLRRLATRVAPGFIRVNSDEVTYPAHIILRYELEKAMIAGDLSLDDLPAAFNAKVKELLGLDVPDDRRGVLQDIHWYSGAFGYFPTYLIGAMTAAQLFAAAKRARPEIPASLATGDFTPLREWMRQNIHEKGCLLDRESLIVAATGEPLSDRHFRDHLRARYVG
ncbi:MAG: carboxypeptidase M32 [Bauldia sp.]